jgi:lipopolysaccharide/colanic/teichoic acid biosynthesis glycosyltransferase
MMSEDQLAARLAERMMTATHPVGHLKLRIYIAWKRSAWKFAIGFTRFVKRAMDVVSSGILIIVLSPLMIVVALLIRRDGGPVFFKQKRVGYRGQEFGMLKFRSMCVDAEAKLKDLLAQNEKGDGITFKMKNDPRITPIGRFIRKVSIVGPRPPLIREVALYSPDDRRRLLATPGITCLWQVGEREGRLFEVGDRNQIEFPEQVNLDVRYIESQSVWKDIMILLKTVPAVLLGKGGL